MRRVVALASRAWFGSWILEVGGGATLDALGGVTRRRFRGGGLNDGDRECI